MRAEILAPVGGGEQLLAAVRCGADAVYLGAKGFNARRNAENFEEKSLPETVSYCRARNVKVFVTVNTLASDEELDALYETLDSVAASGADGAILQDLAAVRYAREKYPTLERVASTQMAVHNARGARMLEEMGFQRLVLARELSLREIETVRESVSIELESFVHGALCTCLSGACYFSSLLGGRSGNRGLCAQPCRLNFVCRGREYALSLKDMSYIDRIRDLENAGVTSLKIEGRMKRPEYVAAAVTACRQAQAGQKYDADALRGVFSRSGFTAGYLEGKRTLDMFGTRRREDVEAASPVLSRLAELYRREKSDVPVDMRVTLGEQTATLAVQCGEDIVRVSGGAPFAGDRPLDEAFAIRQMEKTGGTPYRLHGLALDNRAGLSLRASELNALRRDALDRLTQARGATRPHEAHAFERAARTRRETPETPALWGRFEKAEQVCGLETLARIILPAAELETLDDGAPWDKLACELPAALFPDAEDAYAARLERLKEKGLKAAYCENLYGVALARQLDLTALGGAGLNILNTEAAIAWEKLGLDAWTASFEASMRRIERLGGEKARGLIAYGRLPLMRVRNCPARGEKGCGECRGESELTDRTGARFPLRCLEKRFTTIYNSVPLHIANRQIAPVDFLTLYFTFEDRGECQSVIEDYRLRRPSEAPRTGGLYYRQLQ